MKHEVGVKINDPLPGIYPPVLDITYLSAGCTFHITGPEVLARWVTWLFKHRDVPNTKVLKVGDLGSIPVIFYMTEDAMWLTNGQIPDREDNDEGFIFFIGRESLDGLADSLARAHRSCVEKHGPPGEGVED